MKTIEPKRKIIIDTDPGHDDALALLLLLKSNRFDVQAITTVAGNASIEKVTKNAQAILNLIDCSIPIYSGLPTPIKRELITAVVHGESGLDGFDTSATKFTLTQNAPEKIIEIVRAFPNEVSVLTLGPISNLARAFQLDPELPTLIPEVISMGGAIDVPGNKNRVAEFNFFVDPEAADIVFTSAVKKVVVPLDACNQVTLQLQDFQQVMNTELKVAILPMMEHFLRGLVSDEGTNGILVYDALAAYFLLNPDAFKLTPMNILIETFGEHTSGMCVAEKRLYKNALPNCEVVTTVNQTLFRKDFFKILGTQS